VQFLAYRHISIRHISILCPTAISSLTILEFISWTTNLRK
jgi:hypothetical protein